MGKRKRIDRTIVALGGSCPSLERLNNGDLLVAYRDDTKDHLCISLTRSVNAGRTWQQEHTFTEGTGPGDEDPFYGHTGMAQLADGTILLPYIARIGTGHPCVVVRKSTDQAPPGPTPSR